MKKLRVYVLQSFIIIAASLVVAAMSIEVLHSNLNELIPSGNSIDSQATSPLLYAGGIALIAAIIISLPASLLLMRLSQPANDEIEKQAETFQTLVKTANEAIFLINTDGVIEFINPAAEKLFGYSKSEMIGKNINILMPEQHHNKHNQFIDDYLNTNIKKIIGTGRQLLARRKDGTQLPIYLSVGEIKLPHSHLFAGLIMDLSTQQKLQREILAIPAREQRRIGQELHDGLGQQLTGLSMLAQSLLNKASCVEHDLASQIATELQEALGQVKSLSRGLMPVQIDANGFMLSLREIASSIEHKSNIPIEVQIDDVVLLFDDATATHLYRIVQESLNNAIKHAKATKIDVSLKMEGRHGLLEITDDGIGLPIDLSDSSGLGLNIMRHRCGLFDGEIAFNPNGERGTKVSCRFPLNPKNDNG